MANKDMRVPCSFQWKIFLQNAEARRVKSQDFKGEASAILVARATEKNGMIAGEPNYEAHEYRIAPSTDEQGAKQWILALGEGISHAQDADNPSLVVIECDKPKNIVHYKVSSPGNPKNRNMVGFLVAPELAFPGKTAYGAVEVDDVNLEPLGPPRAGGVKSE